MTTHKPQPIEECLQQIQEALEKKPDHDDLEYWSSDLAFKMEELQGEVAEVKDQVDSLESEVR